MFRQGQYVLKNDNEILQLGAFPGSDVVRRYILNNDDDLRGQNFGLVPYLNKGGQKDFDVARKQAIKKDLDVHQPKIFCKIQPLGYDPASNSESMKETVYALMRLILEQHKDAGADRQTIVVQLAALKGNHTISFAVNTDGECIMFDGLDYRTENMAAIEGFQQAYREIYNKEPKPPIRLTSTEGYQQHHNSCVPIAAKMLEAVDPRQSIEAQASHLRHEMRDACENELRIRQEVYEGVTGLEVANKQERRVSPPQSNAEPQRNIPPPPKPPASTPIPPPVLNHFELSQTEINQILKDRGRVSPHVCRQYLANHDKYPIENINKNNKGVILYPSQGESNQKRLEIQREEIKKDFEISQSKIFFNFESSGGATITKEQLKQAVFQLMSSIFEKRRKAEARGEKPERQMIVAQACHLGEGHTIGFVVNTDGEIVIANGLGSYNGYLDQIINGFNEACKQYDINQKPPQIYASPSIISPPITTEATIKSAPTAELNNEYKQLPSCCVLIAAKVLASADPSKPLSEQSGVFREEMKKACKNQQVLRQEIYDGVNGPAMHIEQRRDQPVKPEPASIPKPPPVPRASPPRPRTEPLASPPLTIKPMKVSPGIERPLVQVARRMVDRAAITDAEARTKTKSVLSNSKCDVEYDEKTKTARVIQQLAHKGPDGKEVIEQREVFSMTDSSITTAPKPNAADLYLALKEAFESWPGQKLVVECSPQDLKAFKVAAAAHLERINQEHKLVGKPPIKDISELFDLKEKKIEKTLDKTPHKEKKLDTPEYETPKPR